MHRHFSALTCFFIMLTGSIAAQDFPDGFGFYLPPDDGSSQRFLPAFPANAIHDFITIDGNGHFTTDDNPIRFWGVNLTTGSCFPVKSKSPNIAARMRKMGINLVRFHHMDNGWTDDEGTIFLRSSGGTRNLDPIALDRLHFFLDEMKRNAVYANINLHVSRTFTENDGVLDADSIWQFGKGVTYFDPQLIDLQKEFAQQLLTSISPYSGLAIADDPVIAMVEITNENTLYGMWKGDELKPFREGGSLMRRHEQMLTDLWQDFLQKKYANDEAIEQAWAAPTGGSGSENQVKDGGFESGQINDHWLIELHENAKASINATNTFANTGAFSGMVTVDQVTKTNWHIQFKQNGLSMNKDSMYALEFYARADRGRPISATFQRDESPWTWYGSQTFQLSTEWKQFRLSLTAPETNDGHLRVSFSFGNQTGEVWFDDIEFSTPTRTGLEDHESLAQRSIERVDYSERLFYSRKRVADQAQFYLNIQRSYYQEMYTFLKNVIGIKVPITGTNALVGPADVYMQQDLDYIDDHAYWNHPRFPSESWSQTDWFIDNESLLAEGDMGTVPDLFGGLALEGKPYTISEYNHPFPNRYHWEMIPIMASYASYHDADGIMFFNYNDGTNSEWENDFIDGFFSIHRNSSIMSMSPLFAHAYRSNLVKASEDVYIIDYDSTFLFNMPAQDNLGRWQTYFPYQNLAAAGTPIRTKSFTASETTFPMMNMQQGPEFITIDEQLKWNSAQRLFTVNTTHLQSVTGNLARQMDLNFGDVTLHSASGDGIISWMALGDQAVRESEASILSIHSRIKNTGMVWMSDQTVTDQWGHSPTLIQALQVDLSLEIDADSIHVYPLDERGAENQHFTVLPDDGRFRVYLDQDIDQTPWFGIQTFLTTTSTTEISASGLNVKLSPNPTEDCVRVQWSNPLNNSMTVDLLNCHGMQMKKWEFPASAMKYQESQLSVSDLAPGIYIIRFSNDIQQWARKLIKL